MAATAAYVASSSSSSSSSGISQTFWSANGPILAVGAGVVAVFGLLYYLANRTSIHRRVETMADSKLMNPQSSIIGSCNIILHCSGISAASASNRARLDSLVEGMSGLVDRADVAERVDQGVGSSPFTRLISKSLSLNFSLFHRMGAVFMQNYLDYYNSLIPNTKFSSRIVRLFLRRLDN